MAENILITGATGTVGSELVHVLYNYEVNVRAGVHSFITGDRLRHFNQEVQLVEMDFHRPESLRLALTGIDRVFLITPFTNTQVAAARNVIDVAKEVGVKQIVRLSAMGADSEPGIQLGRWHRETEQYLAQSGVPYTILRPNSFMQNFITYQGESIRQQGALYQPLGEGRISYIDVFDIAETAAAILTAEVAAHHGHAYTLTGPQALSMAEVASTIGEVTGRAVQYVDVPEDQARQAMQDAPQWMIDGMMELNAIGRAGYAAAVSSEVEQLTGSGPRPFRDFVEQHRHSFVA